MLVRWILLALAALLLFDNVAPAAPPAAEFRNGRWQPIEAPTSQPAPDPVLDRVEQLLAARENSNALKLDLYWVKNHDRYAPLRDRAIFLLAQANYQLDDRIKAYYFLDEVMDEYPESKLFYPALEMQYKIADQFLNGHKLRFLGLSLISADEEAIEMLYRIQQRSPGSPLAEKALLRTADYYYSNRDYDLAHDAYDIYIKDYPRSAMVPNVRLRAAFASLAQFRGIRFDLSMILDARAQLVDIMTAYPELSTDQNIGSIVSAIDETLSAKLYYTADFYRRTHEPRAAVYMYRYLLATYPNAPQAANARWELDRMPKWALNQPMPEPGMQLLQGKGLQ